MTQYFHGIKFLFLKIQKKESSNRITWKDWNVLKLTNILRMYLAGKGNY